MVRGLLDLYEASQESAWLSGLCGWDTQDRLFWDSRGGGYFCSEAELKPWPAAASEGRSVRCGAGLGYWTPSAWFFLGEGKCSVVVKSWQGRAQALLGLHL